MGNSQQQLTYQSQLKQSEQLIVADLFATPKVKQLDENSHFKTMIALNSEKVESVKQTISRIMRKSSPYVTRLKFSEEKKIQQMCSNFHFFSLIFEGHGGISLEEEKIKRKQNGEMFTWKQIDLILETTIKGLKYLAEVNHQYESIELTDIYVTGQKYVILADPWLKRNENKNSFYSPEKQMFFQGAIQSFDSLASCLYEVALLLFTLRDEFRVSKMTILEEVSSNHFENRKNLLLIPDLVMREKFDILLNLSPQRRKKIFSFYEHIHQQSKKIQLIQNIGKLLPAELKDSEDSSPIQKTVKSNNTTRREKNSILTEHSGVNPKPHNNSHKQNPPHCHKRSLSKQMKNRSIKFKKVDFLQICFESKVKQIDVKGQSPGYKAKSFLEESEVESGYRPQYLDPQNTAFTLPQKVNFIENLLSQPSYDHYLKINNS